MYPLWIHLANVKCALSRGRTLQALCASREEVGNLFYVRLGYGAGSPGHQKPHAPVTGNGLGKMVGFPRPGYLRRRRMSASPPRPRRARGRAASAGSCGLKIWPSHQGCGWRFYYTNKAIKLRITSSTAKTSWGRRGTPSPTGLGGRDVKHTGHDLHPAWRANWVRETVSKTDTGGGELIQLWGFVIITPVGADTLVS